LLSQNIAFNKIDSDRNARGAKFWYLMVQVLQHLKQKMAKRIGKNRNYFISMETDFLENSF